MANATAQPQPANPLPREAPRAGRLGGFVCVAREVLHEHRHALAILAAYLTFAIAVDFALPAQRVVRLRVYDHVFFVMLELYTVVFVLGYVAREIYRSVRAAGNVEPGRGLVTGILRSFRDEYLTPHRVLSFAVMVVYARVLTDVFVSLKAVIPLVQPFTWDETFMKLDALVHLGRQPWELFQPLATPLVTATINFFYNAWIFVLFAVFIWQAWSRNAELRKRFFVTFGLSWIVLGTLMATVLSSAGPCYYGRVTAQPHDPYAPLMSYLHEVDSTHKVWALDVQEALCTSYSRLESPTPLVPDDAASLSSSEPLGDMLNGISAMPSMHVAMSVLFALLGWSVGWVAGIAFTAFALVIQIGSFHLGWHYAVDGYVSTVAVVLLWAVTGAVMRRAARQHAHPG